MVQSSTVGEPRLSWQDRRDLDLGKIKRREGPAFCRAWGIFVRSEIGAILEVRESEVVRRLLEKRFPDSRRKAYYLMAIHENFTRIPNNRFAKSVGAKPPSWSKWRGEMEMDPIVQPGCTRPKNYPRKV